MREAIGTIRQMGKDRELMKIGEKNYIKQLRLHNEKALAYVIDEYGGLIMSVIRKYLFYLPEKQEECFDDVLLKIWQNIESFDENKSTFRNWAAAVAKYQAIDYLRSYRKELQTVNIEDAVIVQEDHALAGMIEKEINLEVEKMLECLKPQDRELFYKLYVEEKSMKQISCETGIKQEVIYNRLSRGRKKLRRNILEERGA